MLQIAHKKGNTVSCKKQEKEWGIMTISSATSSSVRCVVIFHVCQDAVIFIQTVPSRQLHPTGEKFFQTDHKGRQELAAQSNRRFLLFQLLIENGSPKKSAADDFSAKEALLRPMLQCYDLTQNTLFVKISADTFFQIFQSLFFHLRCHSPFLFLFRVSVPASFPEWNCLCGCPCSYPRTRIFLIFTCIFRKPD